MISSCLISSSSGISFEEFMDGNNALSLILHGCRMARELESALAENPPAPHLILGSCQEIAAAFAGAVHAIGAQIDPSPPPQQMFDSARVHELLGDDAGGEGSGGGGFGQAVDFLGGGDDIGGGEAGLMGLDSPAVSACMLEFAATLSGRGGVDSDAFSGSSSGEYLAAPTEGSGSSKKRPATVEQFAQRPSTRKRKDGEGSYTVRVPAPRTGNMDNPPDDGYTWRKYGQKDILDSTFPRSYYRCTHKNFYGCPAKKQVQRLDDDPFTYEVTYCGSHTCQATTTPIILPSIPLAAGAGAENPHHAFAPMPEPAAAWPPLSHPSLSTSVHIAGGMPWRLMQQEFGSFRQLKRSLSCGDSNRSSSATGAATVDATPPAAGRVDAGEGSVADLADAMFNSGGGGGAGGSMDAIFEQQESWRRKDDQ